MSWIIGIVGESLPEDSVAKIKHFATSPLGIIDIPKKVYAVAGGNLDTIHLLRHQNSYTLIAGLGISAKHSSSHVLTTKEWNEIISTNFLDIKNLNGHFTILRYENGSVEFFSDRVGLRTLYFAETNRGLVFSSRLSWITKFTEQSSISWQHFGSRWLCGQPFSYAVPLKDIKKLPPNGTAIFKQSKLSIRFESWIKPSIDRTTSIEAMEMLQKIITIPGKKIKLGFSGGLDSRVLLSFLRGSKANFSTYAFGLPSEPDIQLAKRICHEQKIPFTLLHEQFPTQSECLSLFNQAVQQSNLTGSASSSARLRWYPHLKENNSVIIDGGNGEIARRQFFTLLKFRAKKRDIQFGRRKSVSIFAIAQTEYFYCRYC